MDLDERPADGEQRIAQRHRGVGQPARVDDRPFEVALVQAVDEHALVIRLEEDHLQAEVQCAARDVHMDLVERLRAIDLRLARAEQVQVRALEDEDPRHTPPTVASVRRAREHPGGDLADELVRYLGIDGVAVRGREHPAQRATGVLLVGAQRPENGVEIERKGGAAQLERVEERLDPLGSLRRCHATGDADPCAPRAGRTPPPRREAGRESLRPPRSRGPANARG